MIRRLVFVVLAALLLIVIVTAGGLAWLLAGDGARLGLERQLSAWLGQTVRIGDVRATLVPRLAVTLDQVAIGDPARVTLGRIDLSAGLRPLLSRRLEEAEVIVSDSRIEMPFPFALPVAAAAPADDSAADAAAGGMEIVSVRRISLRDLVVVSLDRELQLSADSALNGSRLDITRLTASSGDLRIETQGNIEFAPKVVASLEATSELLDFDSLLALATAFMGTAPGGNAGTPGGDARVSIRVTAPRARAAGLDLTEFEAVVTAYEGELTIDPLLFNMFGGHHEGWLSAAVGQTMDVRVGSSVANLDVAQLAAFGGAAGTISGRMAATGRFGARGRDIATVLASARGVGDVTIASGTMSSLNLVRTVLSFLATPSSEETGTAGDAFQQITGNFALADQRVTTEDLTLESADVDVLGRGSLDLASKRLDGRANLVLSESLSARADQRLYRFARMGNRVVLPATVGGMLGDVSIGIDAGAAIRRGLVNEVERRLENFFERVGPF